MKLVKTTIFSGIITLIKISSGFIAGKAVAIFTGPAGVALIGAFSNFITIFLTFANGAINNGVVKYTADYVQEDHESRKLFSTALRISVICSGVIGCLLILFPGFFSETILRIQEYKGPVRVLGGSIVLYSLNSLFIAILNGKGEIKTYTIVNTIGSVISLIFTIILVYYYKISGALYSLVLSQSIVFFFTLYHVIKRPWFKVNLFKNSFDIAIARKLGSYSLMAIISAITLPISQIFLRNMLGATLGIESAGYWQGIMRISDGYLLIITTALSTYYLPKLSTLKSDPEIRAEILNGYKIVMPVVLIGCLSIFLLRKFIISILFTPDFAQMENLFFWQLFGDFFKIAAWMLAFLMLAKSMTKVYIITEILFTFTYVTLGYILVSMLDLKGIVVSFGLNYFFYFIYMVFHFRNLLFYKSAANV
ncbi:O-antigen translocase [Pedobacter agri]|uniref:O-antigen translocase n=1 Tax=Pedobacter agri TaxID=454586 RepID=A0A9X3DBG8_9SPHI|nr:O-antigen translocase [Pedobacter agri]MCX3264080.1 O-antigen translocase [Pedobacter agri]